MKTSFVNMRTDYPRGTEKIINDKTVSRHVNWLMSLPFPPTLNMTSSQACFSLKRKFSKWFSGKSGEFRVYISQFNQHRKVVSATHSMKLHRLTWNLVWLQ